MNSGLGLVFGGSIGMLFAPMFGIGVGLGLTFGAGLGLVFGTLFDQRKQAK
jgi:hypothetical protein